MKQLNNFLGALKTIQGVLKMKDSFVVSVFSGFLGTVVMDAANFLFWRAKKTEALYGHLAGSILMQSFRLNRRKNFWLGQVMHLITGSILAYPLNLFLKKTGKDHVLLKGAFFGAITWEFVYGIAQRFAVFSWTPHLTKTHYAELFNNILYGITTAQALVVFSDTSNYSGNQNKVLDKEAQINRVQPIYSDVNPNVEESKTMM